MNNLFLLAYCAVPFLVFGKSLDDTRHRRTVFCMPASDDVLKSKLNSVGGFNKDIVAFDMDSARKNLEKAVVESKFQYQVRPTYYKKYTSQNVKHILHSKRKHRPTQDLEIKADTSGTVRSDASNCLEKGSLTLNGNLNLCRKCTVSTTLPPDRYPRFITETVCSPSNGNALDSQGTCIERTIPMVFLKKSGTCVTNNDGTYSQEWKPYTQNVRVGCECEIRQGSFLTSLVML